MNDRLGVVAFAPFLIWITSLPLLAQCPFDWTPVGAPGTGPDAVVRCLATLDDGSGPALYVGGGFTSVGGVPATGLARWDGTTWAPVVGWAPSNLSSVLPDVRALEVWDDGTGPALYVGGHFDTNAGGLVNNVARFDGTSWSALGGGLTSNSSPATSALTAVFDLETFDDGTGEALYAVGHFERADGQPALGLARWDGTTWSAVGPGLNVAALPARASMTVFDDGSGPALFIGGSLSVVGTPNFHFIVKWVGTSFAGITNLVLEPAESMVVHDDGSGEALFFAGPLSGSVFRWDGSSVTSAGQATTMNPMPGLGRVQTLATFDEGVGERLYAAGRFDTIGGVTANGIAQWDGTSWSPLGTGLGATTTLGSDPGVALALHGFDDATNGTSNGGTSLFASGFISETNGQVSDTVVAWRPQVSSVLCGSLGRCASGNVGVNTGGPIDVLLVDGRAGNADRRVNIGLNQPIRIDMAPSPGATSSGFAIFLDLAPPSPSGSVALPAGLGTMCITPCPLAAGAPTALVLTDNFFGFNSCGMLVGSTPAPWTLLVPGGLAAVTRFTLQGLTIDLTAHPFPYAVTNAVLVAIGG